MHMGVMTSGRWAQSSALVRIILVVLIALPTSFARAGDFNDGLRAANRGDYATAMREWKPLAEEGNPNAQFNVGQLYAKGYGVKKINRRLQNVIGALLNRGLPKHNIIWDTCIILVKLVSLIMLRHCVCIVWRLGRVWLWHS